MDFPRFPGQGDFSPSSLSLRLGFDLLQKLSRLLCRIRTVAPVWDNCHYSGSVTELTNPFFIESKALVSYHWLPRVLFHLLFYWDVSRAHSCIGWSHSCIGWSSSLCKVRPKPLSNRKKTARRGLLWKNSTLGIFRGWGLTPTAGEPASIWHTCWDPCCAETEKSLFSASSVSLYLFTSSEPVTVTVLWCLPLPTALQADGRTLEPFTF